MSDLRRIPQTNGLISGALLALRLQRRTLAGSYKTAMHGEAGASLVVIACETFHFGCLWAWVLQNSWLRCVWCRVI